MKILTRLPVSLFVALGAAALLCTAGTSHAQEPQLGTTKTVILIHGAWADGSSWAKVIPRLEAKGFSVAVQLPLTSLANDVATIQRAIAVLPGPMLLVAHSYGGVVITEAGNNPKVSGLVFVAAFAPDAGESAITLNSQYPPSPVAIVQIVPDREGYLKLTPEGILTDFAEDLPL